MVLQNSFLRDLMRFVYFGSVKFPTQWTLAGGRGWTCQEETPRHHGELRKGLAQNVWPFLLFLQLNFSVMNDGWHGLIFIAISCVDPYQPSFLTWISTYYCIRIFRLIIIDLVDVLMDRLIGELSAQWQGWCADGPIWCGDWLNALKQFHAFLLSNAQEMKERERIICCLSYVLVFSCLFGFFLFFKLLSVFLNDFCLSFLISFFTHFFNHDPAMTRAERNTVANMSEQLSQRTYDTFTKRPKHSGASMP